ncbi:extracellular solute-binding protein family 1 [Beutenbergia cavernae DSM 12333]|uniref:Extracellular solute-binding protein family 1 n=1 Tax=Beutenbergia cavernae (strain ATCC BAA-8 / DSM 12333 / CCUG 43141 / JCM 11478 / NBRC 16432 / NCIMB 13614 / HKI 0122) TaxID=471853 RepID=C5C423_BEUC1|nr:sugar ABC transporter substrate-binding protein [Beutenbergia cavernae]ACQ79936.1 extracellular solute-binding protein family 1 [Beutenbergia cavernae DSM 12333]
MPARSSRLSRRQMLALTGGAAAGLTLTACGTGSGGGAAPSGGSSGGGGTLELWANAATAGDSDSQLHQAAAAFGEAHDVTINIQGIPTEDLVPKLTTTSSGGSGPDLAIVDVASVPQLAAAQVLADITEPSAAVADAFGTELLAGAGYDGKQFGLPYTTNNVALYYNEDLLSGAGITVPTTWDELREAAIELTGGEQYGYMMGASGFGSFLFWPWLWQNGGSILTEDQTQAAFADDLGLEAWEFYAGLALTDQVVPSEFIAANASWDQYVAPFVQGRVAMMAIGPWGTAPITEGNPDLAWGVAPLPGQAENATTLGGTAIGVGYNSQQADLAWQFAEWVTAADQMPYIQETGNIPARLDVISSDWAAEDPDRQVFIEQIAVTRARPALPVWGDIEWGVMADAWDSVIQGQQEPAAALTAAAEAANEKLSS